MESSRFRSPVGVSPSRLHFFPSLLRPPFTNIHRVGLFPGCLSFITTCNVHYPTCSFSLKCAGLKVLQKSCCPGHRVPSAPTFSPVCDISSLLATTKKTPERHSVAILQKTGKAWTQRASLPPPPPRPSPPLPCAHQLDLALPEGLQEVGSSRSPPPGPGTWPFSLLNLGTLSPSLSEATNRQPLPSLLGP